MMVIACLGLWDEVVRGVEGWGSDFGRAIMGLFRGPFEGAGGKYGCLSTEVWVGKRVGGFVRLGEGKGGVFCW